jgi:hypothetical protein
MMPPSTKRPPPSSIAAAIARAVVGETALAST